jgi:hypothetical protein
MNAKSCGELHWGCTILARCGAKHLFCTHSYRDWSETLPDPLCISQSGFPRSKSLPANTGTITLRLEDEFKYQPNSEKLR